MSRDTTTLCSTKTRGVTTTMISTYSSQNGTNDMNLMPENLARAQMAARLGEAQSLRRSYELTRARRMSRKAERAAQQARLALARLL